MEMTKTDWFLFAVYLVLAFVLTKLFWKGVHYICKEIRNVRENRKYKR